MTISIYDCFNCFKEKKKVEIESVGHFDYVCGHVPVNCTMSDW